MHIAPEHLQLLEEAVDTAEPILALPRVHPRYIQAVLCAWQADAPRRQVRLVEPYVGVRKLIAGGPAAGGELQQDADLRGILKLMRADLSAELQRQALQRGTGGDLPTTTWTRIWWLPDADEATSDPAARALLASICRDIASRNLSVRIAIGAPEAPLPAGLRPWIRSIEFPTPKATEDHESDYVMEVLDQLADANSGQTELQQLVAAANARTGLSALLRGLDAAAINVVMEAATRWVRRNPELVASPDRAWPRLRVRLDVERKRQLQRASGLSVVQPSSETLEGMHRFKRYLDYVSVLFHDHRYSRTRHNGPVPRGVLLVGLPGCGKSLAAAVTARALDVPLLRMDVGAMMGRYLGESEANLRRALDAAEAAAPCVLWVDELEKALGGLGGSEGGGTGLRMLGQLLTWMQSHKSPVYLFATANKVKALPPELLRRGRFDELWSVTLPEADERKAILHAKLRALGGACEDELLDLNSEAIEKLVHATDGYTGADIACLVQEGWMHASVFSQRLTLAHLEAVRDGGFQPMSKQFGDQIQSDIEALEGHGFRNVWCSNDELPPAVPTDRTGEGGRLPDGLGELWWSSSALVVEFARDASQDGEQISLWIGPRSEGERQVALSGSPFGESSLSTMPSRTLARDGTDLVVVLRGIDGESEVARISVGPDDPRPRMAFDGSIYSQVGRRPAGGEPFGPGEAGSGTESPHETLGSEAWLVWNGARYFVGLDHTLRRPFIKGQDGRVVAYTQVTYTGSTKVTFIVRETDRATLCGLSNVRFEWSDVDGLKAYKPRGAKGGLGKKYGNWAKLTANLYRLR